MKLIKDLTTLYEKSSLPYGPDEDKIRDLLMECIEDHYGTISKKVEVDNRIIDDLKTILDKYL